MEPFEINLDGKTLEVHPQTDGTYLIFEGEQRLARLYPDVQLNGTIWETADVLQEYANQIGELIEEHEM